MPLIFEWPGPLPDLSGLPACEITVTTPRDQAALHRMLAHAGYVLDLVEEGPSHRWRVWHPDGEKW